MVAGLCCAQRCIVIGFLHAGISREAAVHRQADAGNETGSVIVQQKQQCAHKVFLAVAKMTFLP